MAGVEALFLVVAGLLAVAGIAKLHAPGPTARALRDARLPASPVLVRLLGTAEVVVGGGALLVGGRPGAVAVTAAYVVVTTTAWRQRRAGVDCGCFGAASAPVSRLHLTVVGAAVGVGVAAALLAPAGLVAALPTAPWAGLPLLAALALAVVLLRLALIRLPDLAAAEALHPPRRRA